MSSMTVFLSRLIGLTLLILAVVMLVTRPVMLDTIAMTLHDRPLLVALACIELIAGLAIMLRHNIWTTIPAIVVSVIGWLLVIRSLVILLLSPEALMNVFAFFDIRQLYFVYVAILAIIGLYLTVVGFRASDTHAQNETTLS